MTVQRGHAIANGLPLLSINRSGFESSPKDVSTGIAFWGNSFVTGCQGEFLIRAGTDKATLVTDIDMNQTESVRRIWPFMRDRRIDAYRDLTERWLEKEK